MITSRICLPPLSHTQSEAGRQIPNRRAAQHPPPGANHDRHVPGLHFETIQQFLGGLVAIQVDISIGLPVAAEEFPDFQGSGRVLRSQNDQGAPALANQL